MLVRHIEIKVILPDGLKPGKHRYRAQPRRYFTETDIEKFLDQVADDLDRQFPYHEFNFIPRGRNAFTFACIGRRPEAIRAEMGRQIKAHLQGIHDGNLQS